MTPILASQLRYYAQLQQPVRSDDGSGGAAVTWTNIAQCWVGIVRQTASEALNAQRVQVTGRTTIIMRERSDIRAGWRLLVDGIAWRVMSVIPHNRYAGWLEIQAEEIQA